MILQTNTELAAEEFDGEIVLIDIHRGVYFNLRGAATLLWQGFSEARSQEAVLDALAAQLQDANRDELATAMARMQEEKMLIPSFAETPSSTPFTFAPTAYVTPMVEAFSDLADLIAIDPVHEVDAGAGWPVRPDNFPAVD
jgi:hypothetical protein